MGCAAFMTYNRSIIHAKDIVIACGFAACVLVVPGVYVTAAEETHSNRDPAADSNTQKNKLAATYALIPRGIRIQGYFRFDDQGEVSQRRQNLRARFSMVHDAKDALLAYRVKNATVKAFTGEPLKVTRIHPDQWKTVRTRGRRDQNRSLSINFTAEAPPRSALALRRVTGDLHLRIGHPPIEEIEIGPFAEIKGEEQEVPGMPDAYVKIEQRKERLRVTLRGKRWRSLEELQFQNENGDVLQAQNGNMGVRASRNRYTRTLRVELPEQGKLVIRRWSEVSVHKARLEATDVPLPAAFSNDAVELSRAHPDKATLHEPAVALRKYAAGDTRR